MKRVRRATTGNSAPVELPTRITKIAATRRLKCESAPPPEPQLSSADPIGSSELDIFTIFALWGWELASTAKFGWRGGGWCSQH